MLPTVIAVVDCWPLLIGSRPDPGANRTSSPHGPAASTRSVSPTRTANFGVRSRVIVSVCPVEAISLSSPAHDAFERSGSVFGDDGGGDGDGGRAGAALQAESIPAVVTRPASAGLQPCIIYL